MRWGPRAGKAVTKPAATPRGHGEGHPGFGDAGPGSGRAVSSPCQLRGMLPARSRAHPKPAAPIPKEEKAFMRSQQGAGAAESPQSPPVNPGISRLGSCWVFCFRRDVLVPDRQQGCRGGEGNTRLLPGQSQLWLGLTPVRLWGPLALHPSSTPITSSASLHRPWHSSTRILCPELVSAGCSSLHFPGLGGSCACDASPTAESVPTRDGFASRTRLRSRTTKPPPVPAPLLALHPRLTAPGT